MINHTTLEGVSANRAPGLNEHLASARASARFLICMLAPTLTSRHGVRERIGVRLTNRVACKVIWRGVALVATRLGAPDCICSQIVNVSINAKSPRDCAPGFGVWLLYLVSRARGSICYVKQPSGLEEAAQSRA